MVPVATGAITEVRRHASRAAGFDLVAGGGGGFPGRGDMVVERRLAVDLGFPLSEQVEVGTRQHEDQFGRHHPRSSRSAAVTPKPTMIAGSKSVEPRAMLPMTMTTTRPVRPVTRPITKATTARPNSDQPVSRAIAAKRAPSSRRCRTGSGKS